MTSCPSYITDRYLILSWLDVEKKVIELGRRVEWEFDSIVGVLRGGFYVANLLSQITGKELKVVWIKSYKGEKKGESEVVTWPHEVKGKRVLLVDDVVDYGDTLELAKTLLKLAGTKEVRSASLFLKPWAKVKPDYFLEETDKWILFPWESCEIVKGKEELARCLVSMGIMSEELASLCVKGGSERQ